MKVKLAVNSADDKFQRQAIKASKSKESPKYVKNKGIIAIKYLL